MDQDIPSKRYPEGSLVLVGSDISFDVLNDPKLTDVFAPTDETTLLITGYEARTLARRKRWPVGHQHGAEVETGREWCILGIMLGHPVKSVRFFRGGGEMMKHFTMVSDIRDTVG